VVVTDSSGAIVWRAEHEPYGNVYLMRKGSRTDEPLRLPGQDLAMTWEGTEENYNVFRWYRGGSLTIGPVELNEGGSCKGLGYTISYPKIGEQAVVGSVCTTKVTKCTP
jgi:hypothetical protein